MGLKSIVLSLKKGDRVVSWEGERRMADLFHRLDRSFFAAPEQSPFFLRRAREWEHPTLGTLTRSTEVPGTVGWIGMDLDRRILFDLQGQQELGMFVCESRDLQDVPAQVAQACMEGPWATSDYSTGSRRVIHPAAASVEGWEATLRAATDRAVARRVKALNEPPDRVTTFMAIEPPIPPGWTWVESMPREAPAGTAVVWRRALAAMKKAGWQPFLEYPEPWLTYFQDYMDVPRDAVGAWLAADRRRELDRELPAAPPAKGPSRPRM